MLEGCVLESSTHMCSKANVAQFLAAAAAACTGILCLCLALLDYPI